MTREERKAITNGIWLCGTHADEIDKDKLRFRASTLFHWKTEAERRALQSRGRAPEGKQALETLTQALSGYPEKLIPDAIRNVARCSQSALEKVMPGTNVSVNLIDGVPTYTFTPKNWDVPPIINVIPKDEYERKLLDEKLAEGRPFVLPEGFHIRTDFPLAHLGQAERVKISFDPANKLDAELVFTADIDGRVLSVSFPGQARAGSSLLSFEPIWGDKLLELALEIWFGDNTEKQSGLTANLNISVWNESRITNIPYFSKIQDFSRILSQDLITLAVLIQGNEVATFALSGEQRTSNLGEIVEVMKIARAVAAETGTNPLFSEDEYWEFAEKSYLPLTSYVQREEVLEGIRSNQFLSIPIKLKSDEVRPEIQKGCFKTESPSERVPFWGQVIEVPSVSFIFMNIELQIVKTAQTLNGLDGEIRIRLSEESMLSCTCDGPLSIKDPRSSS